MVSVPRRIAKRHPHAVNGTVEVNLAALSYYEFGRFCLTADYLIKHVYSDEIQMPFHSSHNSKTLQMSLVLLVGRNQLYYGSKLGDQMAPLAI